MIEVTLDRMPFINCHENVVAVTNTAFRLLTKDIVKDAKDNIGINGLINRSGALKESIRVSAYTQFSPNSGGSATISAGNSRVPYANIHEVGGVIRPRNGEYLHFQVAGNWRRVRQVTMPKRPYIKPAVDKKVAQFDSYIQSALNRIADKL